MNLANKFHVTKQSYKSYRIRYIFHFAIFISANSFLPIHFIRLFLVIQVARTKLQKNLRRRDLEKSDESVNFSDYI